MASEDKLRDYLNLVTANLRQARRRLREVEGRNREPIAIVGMGCRVPRRNLMNQTYAWRIPEGVA